MIVMRELCFSWLWWKSSFLQDCDERLCFSRLWWRELCSSWLWWKSSAFHDCNERYLCDERFKWLWWKNSALNLSNIVKQSLFFFLPSTSQLVPTSNNQVTEFPSCKLMQEVKFLVYHYCCLSPANSSSFFLSAHFSFLLLFVRRAEKIISLSFPTFHVSAISLLVLSDPSWCLFKNLRLKFWPR